MSVARGDILELAVERLVAGGDGLARREGKAIFVAGVLPGERVHVRLLESRKDFDRAALVEVLEPSADRVPPACALAGVCGACDWLHASYPAQLALKQGIVRETFRRTGRIEREAIPIEGGAALGYRNRVQLHRHPSSRLGYMAGATNRVVPADTCPIAVAPINALLADPSPVASSGLDRFTVFSDAGWIACEGRDDDRQLSVSVAGRSVRFSVGCFFQANLAMLDQVSRFLAEGIETDRARGRPATGRAADLYCGVGVFAAVLAGRFDRVTCVESNTLSLGFARANVPPGSLETFPTTVEQWIQSGAARDGFDAVVVDPPRAGLSREVIQWLTEARPGLLVYVSCNPVTLARDVGHLARGGYALDDLRLFDFYPQTSHLEAVAVLTPTG